MLEKKKHIKKEAPAAFVLTNRFGKFFGFVVAAVLCLLPSNSFSQVTSAIDSTSIKIGEEIQYSIQVQADTTDVVVFPEGQTFMPLEVIESYKIDTTFEKAKYNLIKKYGLTQFDSGSYTIPQQRVIINSKPFITDSVQVEVRDVVVDTLTQKMFDIKPAIEVDRPPFDYSFLWVWLLPILLLLAVLGFILFRRKQRKAAKEVVLPPYEEALVALKKLDESELLKQNDSKAYYSNLTEIVKRYLDREVDNSALESTTDELIERLLLHKDSGNFDFDRETIRHLDQILKRADLVKFAKMQQETGQVEADRSTIEEIINETHEVIPEPSEEELLANEQYKEMLQKKRVRKNWILGISSVVAALLLSGIIYGSVKGFDNLKDAVFGNEIRALSEGRWIKSEYGSPAIIIETPEVLVRTDVEIPDGVNTLIKDMSTFSFGEKGDPLYVMVTTSKFYEPQEVNLEDALEGSLAELERAGATNMVVKQDDFETEKGIKGKRAFGKFNVKVSDTKVLKEESSYQLLIFAQKESVQQVLIVYQDDGRFAEGIKKRITDSIELEISESKN
ncbi:DUF4381 family protein [Ulvibacter litoralis]|uniref:DUF4381 domain-containing protein n=1 Tax=Ulvibacter litoralis TaxID=227084 RepID=A0A1G7DGQ4_9FLAO|nr:DUF4381 family protein [Ulvibacter litoralis]GHC43528.1 hypothetical protein GCM10008083_02400 [Ulvibacter litoralis]SDE50683.1 hypothetical protein SAMN05421855_101970 [Ulvibacter litoralis]